jgi:hypothetical protein
MRFGDASGRLDAEFNPFADEYLGEILGAVAVAWARMKQPRFNELEDQITRKLVACLRHNRIFRELPFDITQQFILDDVDANYLGRLDLHVKYRQSQRDYFAFEAKRLHLNYGGKIVGEYSSYVGSAGMGAFIEGPYSNGLPTGGMLGYVMNADTENAWIGLGKSIESKREVLRLLSSSQLIESALKHHVTGGSPGTLLGETIHGDAATTLRMFHLLLPVRPTAKALH